MTWQPKSSLTVETSHWTWSNMDSVPLHSSSRLWDLVSKWNAKFTFIWKEDFGPLSNSPVLFLHSPGKTLLTLSLVQKWLGSPFPEDVWAWWLLMHWLQLQFTPCEALTSVWISFAWLYSQACRHPCCLCTFSYPNSSFQSTLHPICFDTALCKQPHLSVMTLCDLPSLWRASESESEWALLARYVYTYEEFVIVTKLHSATEWQQRDRTQTTKEQYTNVQIGNVQNSKNTMQYRQSCVYRSDVQIWNGKKKILYMYVWWINSCKIVVK